MSDNSFKPYELDPNYRAIADHIGIDAFNKLVWLCGGEVLYIPKNDKDCTKSNAFTHSGKK